jgi:divinyl protochlorophyllide a 8-vinyl-reductase
VPESDVSLLYRTLRERAGEAAAAELGRDAGARTARYLLANRIPRVVQRVLRRLPPRLAASALLAAISRNTWTFAGSGRVKLQAGRPVRIAIEACPLCRDETLARPACDYYAGTFEGLFRALVAGDARAVESACAATGADACRFEIGY